MDYCCYIDTINSRIIGIYPENATNPTSCELYNELIQMNPTLTLASISVTKDMAEQILRENRSTVQYNLPEQLQVG